jgi:hypothetical protein
MAAVYRNGKRQKVQRVELHACGVYKQPQRFGSLLVCNSSNTAFNGGCGAAVRYVAGSGNQQLLTEWQAALSED